MSSLNIGLNGHFFPQAYLFSESIVKDAFIVLEGSLQHKVIGNDITEAGTVLY